MPEQEPPRTAAELPPDREREAGFRGDAFVTASILFGLVFVAGFALLAGVLRSRRRSGGDGGGRGDTRP